MKIVQFLSTTTILALSMTSVVLAGGLAGGGGPPSRELLEEMLRTQGGRAALFVWDEQTYGLGVDKSLVSAMTLTTTALSGDTVALAPNDYQKVAIKQYPVNAINRDGITRSYRVYDGLEQNTLLLIDRRLLMRSGKRL
ncbi:MAG TPA: hypothetical protein VE954_34365 [Oligoflexus sp.]|uniref:hypothetical protein n=1 Tax=Oligoflexus sp. TaxID=1971216 RepID=UPI002D395E26|nr:hypothetical protein [Oligoflexus sp.]HYX38214.1 hypothetical protein [Oligoflexus sp.]